MNFDIELKNSRTINLMTDEGESTWTFDSEEAALQEVVALQACFESDNICYSEDISCSNCFLI